jgi:hypothetical protein
MLSTLSMPRLPAWSCPNVIAAMNVKWRNRSQDPIEKRFEDLLEVSTHPLAYEIYNIHPLALQMRMRQSDGDTPTFKDVLKMEAEERSKWYDAMDAELSSLLSKLVEMDRPSLPTEVEEGLGRRSAVAEAILWAE